jgi:ElaB/YqjD/DUF883 family membrane-anchored ribosome-binding protein
MSQFDDGNNSVTDQARGLTEQARSRASSTVKEQLDTRSTQAGEQMQKVAGAMRQSSDQLREQAGENPAMVNDAVAERVERLSSYLTNANAEKMLSDFENVARRRPWMVAGAATVLGFTLSRFLKASGRTRYEQQFGSSNQRRELPPARPLSPESTARVDEVSAIAGSASSAA